MEAALKRAIQTLGPAALSRHLRISHQTIPQWRLCPPRHVLTIERLTGVSRHELRPDIYPREVK